jgi:hypothetical protein
VKRGQKKQILELIQTLEKAQSAGLFADCLEGSLQIAKFIERVEGANAPILTPLAEYRDLLRAAARGGVSAKKLRKQLIRVGNSAEFDLTPDRLEIAFISYKASISDSIEPIYLAAKANPRCDPYWIPVPYYERRADGSFGPMRYEGAGCYDGDIAITPWRDYDLAGRRPDMIFTFNPYDGANLVTSIHPDFYCARLREYTDLLVYVPYFVSFDNVEDYFCLTAGCAHAHKVILQSEKIRGTYISVFKERYGGRFGKPEDKFLALGSPKFDKILGDRREDQPLPDAWRRLIGGKKTALYNTNVSGILAGGEQHLQKLRHVLAAFRAGGDVALWWRPHPLSEATYASMRPDMLEEYKGIVADYRREGWGVYDDTPDLRRAIAWSDAYYGDWSSLVALYWLTGKPLMIGDIMITDRPGSGGEKKGGGPPVIREEMFDRLAPDTGPERKWLSETADFTVTDFIAARASWPAGRRPESPDSALAVNIGGAGENILRYCIGQLA